MSRLKYDYSAVAHVVDAMGGLSVLETVKDQAEGLELPRCPFCGGEAVVALGSAYGQPTVAIECSRCHSSTVRSGPSYDYLRGIQRMFQDALNEVARRWSRREKETA